MGSVVVPEPVKVEAESPAEDPKVGRRFAELSKRQRDLFQKEQSLKEMETRLSPVSTAMADIRKNPMALLQAAGLTYEELTDFILNDGFTEAELPPTVEKKLEALEFKLAEKDRKEQASVDEASNARVQEQISSFKESIKAASAHDDYELVSSLGKHDLVYDLILEHHAQHGEVLDIGAALAATEAYLSKETEKLFNTKKFAQNKPQASSQGREQQTAFTLSAKTPSPTATSQTKMTAEQAKDAAISSLRFRQ